MAVVFLTASCEKNFMSPGKEMPVWLKVKIAEDESVIKSDPKLMNNYGAWIRYEFRDKYYYEYDNPLSSFYFYLYTEEGNQLNISDLPLSEYLDEKCCPLYLWKAPGRQ